MPRTQRQVADHTAEPLLCLPLRQHLRDRELCVFSQQFVEIAAQTAEVDFRLRDQIADAVQRDRRCVVALDAAIDLGVTRIV